MSVVAQSDDGHSSNADSRWDGAEEVGRDLTATIRTPEVPTRFLWMSLNQCRKDVDLPDWTEDDEFKPIYYKNLLKHLIPWQYFIDIAKMLVADLGFTDFFDYQTEDGINRWASELKYMQERKEHQKMFKDLERDVVRVLGAAHPFTDDVQYNRKATEAKLFHSNFGGSGGS